MKISKIICIALLLLAPLLQYCEKPSGTPLASFQKIPAPARGNSGEPNLTRSPQGEVYLSWVEAGEMDAHVLKFSRWNGTGWAAPGTIAEGTGWFVNWADFPSVVAGEEGWLAAHWLAKSGEDTYAYNVNIAISRDGGQSWRAPLVPHDDGTPTEHGFVSLLPLDDHLLAVWLDGRNYVHAESDAPLEPRGMTLRAAVIGSDGTIRESALLDALTCDCCQTSAAPTAHGAIVAYRDRSAEEIRDIAVVRYENGQWSAPQTVHQDGWQINGCPVNGPALAAADSRVALAWYTEAAPSPRVLLAFSQDAGRSFGAPVVVDDRQPIGRVDVALDEDGGALVSWVAVVGDSAEIRLRKIYPDATGSAAVPIARTVSSRASGFPHLVRSGKQLIAAWTLPGEESRVLTAVAQIIN